MPCAKNTEMAFGHEQIRHQRAALGLERHIHDGRSGGAEVGRAVHSFRVCLFWVRGKP